MSEENNEEEKKEEEKPEASKKLERFGRYLILDHLVDGGMAKICRARFLGEKADKVVAIKMVQPQFSKDESFKTMFMDEIKVCFGLNHPNIAQTYDYGLINEQLYTAMEYVEGANLKQFLDKLNEKKYVFPVEISLYITSQICQGLHYAHNFTDKLNNRALNIIHRDISPHNIMVTFDGAIKVIDFGIAKAETNSESTQAGTIKGKLSYLAPEYLEGLKLDHRYDQFAVGITLWELLCSKKLFTAANDLAVLKKIQQCKVPPPSSINPNVPKELDQIVLKALSKDRNLRYEDMDQFNRALNKFLYAKYPDFNPSDLKYFAHELFKEKIEADKLKMQEFGQIDIGPYLEEIKNEGNKGSGGGGSAVLGESQGIGKRVEIDLGFNADEVKGFNKKKSASSGISLETGDAKKKRGTTQVGLKIPANISSSTNTVKTSSGKTNVNTKSTDKVNEGTKSGTQSKDQKSNLEKLHKTSTSLKKKNITKSSSKEDSDDIQEDNSSSSNKKKLIIRLVAGIAVVGIGLSQFLGTKPDTTKTDLVTVAQDDHHNPKRLPSSKNVKAQKAETIKEKGKVVLGNLDINAMKIYVNDELVEYSSIKGLELDLNKEYLVRIEERGFLPFFQKVTLSKQEMEKTLDIPALERATIGLLTTSNNYENSQLKITVNGNQVKINLPVKEYELPAGAYSGVIYNGNLNSEKPIEFEILEDKKTIIE